MTLKPTTYTWHDETVYAVLVLSDTYAVLTVNEDGLPTSWDLNDWGISKAEKELIDNCPQIILES